MRNKRGDGYITTCITVIILCMLVAVFITFTTAINIVRTIENNSKIVLDSFVMKNSILIYDSIKNGNDQTESLDGNVYIDDLCDFCTLEKIGGSLYAYDNDGALKYRLSKPTISFSTQSKLKIFASYTVFVPIQFCGITVDTAKIPITVDSKYNDKF